MIKTITFVDEHGKHGPGDILWVGHIDGVLKFFMLIKKLSNTTCAVIQVPLIVKYIPKPLLKLFIKISYV